MSLQSGIRAGGAYVELFSKDAGFIRSMKKAQRMLRSFSQAARAAGRALAAGGGSVVGAMSLATRVFAKAGDQIQKMSLRTGFSAEALSELGFAAEQSGTDINTLEKGIKTMQRSIVDASRGLSTQNDALDAMGLSVNQLIDLSPEEQFNLIADAISKMEDPTKRAAAAAQFFGRAGVQLLPLFKDGAAGMKKLREEARELGLTIGGDAASNAAELTDAMNRSKRVMTDLVFEIGGALAPAATELANTLAEVIKRVASWIKENREMVVVVAKVAGIVTAAGLALVGIGLAATVASIAIGGIVSIFAGLGTIIGVAIAALGAILSPIGLVVAAVVGIGAAVAYQKGVVGQAIGSMSEIFGKLKTTATDTFSGIKDALQSGDLKLAGEVAMTGLKLAWEEGTKKIREIWGKLEDWILKAINNIVTKARVGWDRIATGASLLTDIVTNEGQNQEKIFNEHNDRVLDLTDGQEDLDAGIDARREKKQADLETRIKELSGELAQLTKQAAAAAARTNRNRTPALPDPLSGFGAAPGSQRSASGVFQSSAIGSLLGQSSPVEKEIAENTRLSAEQLKTLLFVLRNNRTGRGVFG